jgi:4-diphosphocytidyl-2-C-methyl-D-erythritol kinase
MICFPNAKINLGLHVTGKRSDGFHTIETLFYPIPLRDTLEAVESDKTSFTQTGIDLEIAPEENLVMKAYARMSARCKAPTLTIYLKKTIPSGAGLGGGSADAAFMLKLLNKLSENPLSENSILQMASSIGADCPFFIRNTPVIATGTGNIFHSSDVSLKGYTLYIVKPPFAISTKEAYAMVKPQKPAFSLEKLSFIPVHEWKHVLFNDFEPGIFEKYPVIKDIKEQIYAMGAEYASMSGSGSAVFGLFKKTVSPTFPDCFVWNGILD